MRSGHEAPYYRTLYLAFEHSNVTMTARAESAKTKGSQSLPKQSLHQGNRTVTRRAKYRHRTAWLAKKWILLTLSSLFTF